MRRKSRWGEGIGPVVGREGLVLLGLTLPSDNLVSPSVQSRDEGREWEQTDPSEEVHRPPRQDSPVRYSQISFALSGEARGEGGRGTWCRTDCILSQRQIGPLGCPRPRRS
jgi:hypothetical protein